MKLSLLAAMLALAFAPASISLARPDESPATPPPAANPAPVLEVSLAVETRGTGPIQLVLVPGLSCDWTVWDAFMKRNAEKYTMHAVTLPGFGGRAAPPAPAEGAKFSDTLWLTASERALVNFIKEKQLDRPVLVGHSLGGHLACRIAARNPGLLRSAVAVDGMPAYPLAGPGVPMATEQREKMATSIYRNLVSTPDDQWPEQQRNFFAQMVTDQHRAEELSNLCLMTSKEVSSRYMAELLASDVITETKSSDTPIALFAAVAPPGVPGMTPETVKRIWAPFADESKSIQLVYFEECRHFIMDDAPAELDKSIAQFIAGEAVEGRKAQEPVPAEEPPAAPKE